MQTIKKNLSTLVLTLTTAAFGALLYANLATALLPPQA